MCHCLPQDYRQTIGRLRRLAVLREEAVPQLEALSTAELVNCHLLAAMLVHVQEKVYLLVFCDWVKELVDNEESKTFIDNLKLGGSF